MKGFSQTASLAKEKEPQGKSVTKEEEIKVREAQQQAEIAKELEAYIRHVEIEPKVPPELSQIGVVNPAQAATQVLEQGPTIVLPVSQEEIKKGLLAPVWQAVRWLAEWSMRVIKIGSKHNVRVVFKEEKEIGSS